MSNAPEPIHTLTDLAAWSFPGTALAVVGRPVGHSLSPAMHNAALADLARLQARFGNWRYFKFDIAPDELPRALQLFHQKKFHGLNLTVPHKSLAIEHLVSGDDFVRAAGAANTLSAVESGWQGANTDGFGLSTALRQERNAQLAGANVVLLGAGGAARAAAVECLQQRCASLWIGNRSQPSLHALLASVQPFAQSTRLAGFVMNDPPRDLPEAALVINATSLGLAPADASPLDLRRIPRPALVYDMIYRPPQTALLRQAAELGIPHANGLSMLIHQGARSLEIWTGMIAPVPTMQAAASRALGNN